MKNEFLEKANIDSKYIKFEQGGPYNTNSLDIDLKVASENNNENISLATKGTYYECVAIICENGKNKEFIKNEFTQNITCQNNNKPTYNLESPNNLFPINSSCQQSSVVDEETKGYAFIIKKYTYDCDATIKSPDTGVNNYYLVLGILIGVFTIVLSIINKKNVFKKI